MAMTFTKLTNHRTSVLLTFVRYRRNPKAWKPDAVKYGHIQYYPKNKTVVDPPITPTKVFMVHRVKPFKGNPWWEKDTLKRLGFKENYNDPVFVKNTPELCQQLWKVKHLVEIIPLKMPKGDIKTDDSMEYYFHPNGTVHICGKIDPARVAATENFINSMKRMQYRTIAEKLRLKWLKGNLI